MPKLQALRSIFGDYGLKHEGDIFEVPEPVALSLESRGLAMRVREPGLLAKMIGGYENKMLTPPENKQEPPAVIVTSQARTPEPPVVLPQGFPIRHRRSR